MATEGRAEVLERVERARAAMRLLGAIWPTLERAVMARAEEAIVKELVERSSIGSDWDERKGRNRRRGIGDAGLGVSGPSEGVASVRGW
jgi:hypothetical protein